MSTQKHTALAVCEFCSFCWAVIMIGGTVYLTGWCGWSYWTWLGSLLMVGMWTCRYCPGHAKYGAVQRGDEL